MFQSTGCRIALAAALSLFAFARADAAYHASDIDLVGGFEEPHDIVAESRLYCLALAVYFEGGSTAESIEGQEHIARVVSARAKDRVNKWGGGDVCNVVFYKRGGVCQFSFACLPTARRTPRGGARWEQALSIARREMENASDLQERAIRYYLNPDLTSDRNECRFRKEFVPVVKAGRHEFFREPSAAERAALLTSPHPACVRYAAALEAEKQRAKALAAKRHAAALAKKRGKKPKLAQRSAARQHVAVLGRRAARK
jgi:Cell Wall Hydrolase